MSAEKGIDVEEANKLFGLGLVCAILSPAGPRKERQLTLIMKDERVKISEHFELL